MSHEELSARMDKQDAMLLEIRTALVGDKLGNPGLVARVQLVEAQQAAQERTMIKWAGVAAGASIVISFLKSKLMGGA